MRAIEFIYSILDKYAPMNEIDRAELRRDAQVWYGENKDKAELAEETAPMKKVFKVLEHWGFRTALAVLYIYILPQIQAYMDGGAEELEEDDL